MEARYGLGQFFGRIPGQKALEMAEGLAALVEILGLFHQVVTGGSFNEQVHPPVAALTVHVKGFPLLCLYQVQGLPVRVSSVFYDLLP